MPTITRSLRGICAAVVLLVVAPRLGQRVQFPTMLVQDTSVYGGPIAGPSTSTVPPVGTFRRAAAAGAGNHLRSLCAERADRAADVGSVRRPGGAAFFAVCALSLCATPGSASPSFTEGWTMPSLPANWFESTTAPLKLVQSVGIRTAELLPLGGSNKLGVTETNIAATFAIPVLYNQAPLLITPGFTFDFFQGPISTPPVNADLPPTTYSAYLDFAWRPRILPSVTPWLSADLGVRTGIYTDFSAVNSHSIRVLGRGLALATITERVQLVLGVVYLDRVLVKILPAGGVIWTPNPDARYEFFFPSPKFAAAPGTPSGRPICGGFWRGNTAAVPGRFAGPRVSTTRSTTTTFACRWVWNRLRSRACTVFSKSAMSSIAHWSTGAATQADSIRATRSCFAPAFRIRRLPAARSAL